MTSSISGPGLMRLPLLDTIRFQLAVSTVCLRIPFTPTSFVGADVS